MSWIWKKIDRKTDEKTGETVITYGVKGLDCVAVQSITHKKEHFNGNPGTWDYTDYHALYNGKLIGIRNRLSDAQKLAESYFYEARD